MNTATKSAIAVVVLALVAMGGYYLSGSQSDGSGPDVSGQYEQYERQTFQRGLTVGDGTSGANDLTFPGGSTAVIGGSMRAGTRIDYWQNTTGATVYVSNAVYGWTSGTASSTYQHNLFATTTSPTTIASLYSYTAMTEAINGISTFLSRDHQIATSTTATTTSSVLRLTAGRGSGMVAVPNNGYLIYMMQNIASGGGGPLCSGSVCETATSSNRGFNPFWRASYVR